MIDESEVNFVLLAKFQDTAIASKTYPKVVLSMFSLLTDHGFTLMWIAD
jgi:hypothetical protein